MKSTDDLIRLLCTPVLLLGVYRCPGISEGLQVCGLGYQEWLNTVSHNTGWDDGVGAPVLVPETPDGHLIVTKISLFAF